MIDKMLPLPQKALAFTACLTVQEFLDARPLLRQRLAEIRMAVSDQEFLTYYPDYLNCLILLNEESPETLVVVPILMRLAAACPRMVLNVVRDTDDLSGVAALVEEAELPSRISEIDLPQLLIFDEEWIFEAQWGPHPKAAEAYLDEWFERHPEYETLESEETLQAQQQYAHLLDRLTQEMRVWYNSNLNRACVSEICALLASLLDENTPDESEDEENSATNDL